MAQITYQPKSGDKLLPGARAITERLSPINGVFAGCGEASLVVILMLMGKVQGTPLDVTNLILALIRGGFSKNGTSTPKDIEWLAKSFGVTIQGHDINSTLDAIDGSVPVELGVSNATAFGGTDSNVHGHYITILGKTVDGLFIVSDPWSIQSKTGQLVVYSRQQINNARPFWAGIPQGFQDIGGGAGMFGDIAQAIRDFPQTLITQVEDAFKQIPSSIDKFFADLFHVENTQDFTYRVAFVLVGITLAGIGAIVMAMITEAEIDKGATSVVEGQAQQAAPIVQSAAALS